MKPSVAKFVERKGERGEAGMLKAVAERLDFLRAWELSREGQFGERAGRENPEAAVTAQMAQRLHK